ncbi:hypothetical protein BH23PLA1_BH23PLA1_08140 [soil metagenome]
MDDGVVRLGVVGRGGFGRFALQHFTLVLGVEDINEVGELLRRDDVDLADMRVVTVASNGNSLTMAGEADTRVHRAEGDL